jgi:hypothetical protein
MAGAFSRWSGSSGLAALMLGMAIQPAKAVPYFAEWTGQSNLNPAMGDRSARIVGPPLANLKPGSQYVIYTRFNGGTRNYDGSGHGPQGNDTLCCTRGLPSDGAGKIRHAQSD